MTPNPFRQILGRIERMRPARERVEREVIELRRPEIGREGGKQRGERPVDQGLRAGRAQARPAPRARLRAAPARAAPDGAHPRLDLARVVRGGQVPAGLRALRAAPGLGLADLRRDRDGGLSGRHAAPPPARQPLPRGDRVPARAGDGGAAGAGHRLLLEGAGRLRSDHRVLPSPAAPRLLHAPRHLARDRERVEDRAPLSRGVSAAVGERDGGRERGDRGADPGGALARRESLAGVPLRGVPVVPAGHLHGHAGEHRLHLHDPGGRRDGRRDLGDRLDGPGRVQVPPLRRHLHGQHRHGTHRDRARPAHPDRAEARS